MSSRGEVGNMLDCNIVVSQFKFQFSYYSHFHTNTLEKGLNPFIPSYELNSTTTTFHKGDFRIKLSTKVDIPLNKETILK